MMIAVANSVVPATVFDPLLPLLMYLSSGFFAMPEYECLSGGEWSAVRSKYPDV